MNEPFLHLYAQEHYHSDAMIIGNREALIKLRKAIDLAIEPPLKRNTNRVIYEHLFYTNDGEGYTIIIRCIEGNNDFDQYGMPYTFLKENEML